MRVENQTMVKKEGRPGLKKANIKIATKCSPVISLTIIDKKSLDPDGIISPVSKVLVGIRNPETNLTHPNVLSVPTQRIPVRVLQEFLKGKRSIALSKIPSRACPAGLSEIYLLCRESVDSQTKNSHNPAIYVAESILSRKLGMASFLEKEQVSFITSPMVLVIGNVLEEDSYNHSFKSLEPDEGEDNQECIEMCNLMVLLSKAKHLPKNSTSYSVLHWIEIKELIKIAEGCSPQHIIKGIGEQSVEPSSRGFCLFSAYLSILYANNNLRFQIKGQNS